MRGNREQARRGTAPRRTLGLLIPTLLLAIFGHGCARFLQKTVEAPIQGIQSTFSIGERQATLDPVKLQEDLLRYSDHMTSTVLRAAMKLEKDGAPISREDLLMTWVTLDSAVIKTATGSNSLANLVNMIVLTTAARMRVEEYWLPKVYGESARPMLDGLSSCEKEIWLLGEQLFTPVERQELLDTIGRRIQEAREREGGPVGFASFANTSLVSEIVESHRSKENDSLGTSVFNLLDVDPLAGLDPATRELAQTRLLAERMMFIGQRMPQIIQWQAEWLTIETAELPQVEQLVANSTQLAQSIDRVSVLADELLRLVSSKDPGLVNLSRDIGSAFSEGARMAGATDAALKTFDSVAARFDKEEGEPDPNKVPFRIKDYADTAAEIGKATERLTTLFGALQSHLAPETMNRMSVAADAIAAQTEARGKDVVDYAFRRGLQLVVAVLLAALVFRLLSARIGGSGAGGTTPG